MLFAQEHSAQAGAGRRGLPGINRSERIRGPVWDVSEKLLRLRVVQGCQARVHDVCTAAAAATVAAKSVATAVERTHYDNKWQFATWPYTCYGSPNALLLPHW